MAGRRRDFGGLATGLNVLSAGLQSQFEHAQKRQDATEDFERRYALAVKLAEVKAANQPISPASALQTERLGLAQARAPLPEGGFAPSEIGHPQSTLLLNNRIQAMRDVGLGGARPAVPRAPDPLLEASRLATTMRNLQTIELLNADQPKARPASAGGWFGIGAHPAVPGGPTIDTRLLRQRLDRLPSGASEDAWPDPAGYAEGTLIVNDATGQRRRKRQGHWIQE